MKQRKERLQTQRLLLRPLEEEDRPQMMEIYYSAEVKKTYMLPDFTDQSQADALFDRMRTLSQNPERFVYGICFEQKLIGFVNDCEQKDTTIELGYVIAPKFQGRGFATEALSACIEALFSMGFTHVKAGYFEGNVPSRRVMEKCGMRKLDFEEDIEYRGALRHCFYLGIDCKESE